MILFAKGGWFALPELQATGASALGLDWTIEPSVARKMASGAVLQGNLDPIVLLGPATNVEKETNTMLKNFGVGNYIANLGHGVLPFHRNGDVEHGTSPTCHDHRTPRPICRTFSTISRYS